MILCMILTSSILLVGIVFSVLDMAIVSLLCGKHEFAK